MKKAPPSQIEGRAPETSKAKPCAAWWLSGGEHDQHLAGVVALEDADESAGSVLEAFDDLLAVLQLALFDPLGHLSDAFGEPVHELGNDEPLGPRLLAEQIDVGPH